VDNIARPALARVLEQGLDGGSVLLVAGAGYGKTTALEETLRVSNRNAVWLSCSNTGGDAGRLMVATVDGLREAVPGLADVLGDRLAAGAEPVDVPAAARGLRTELERMLMERLVIVFDDAEELESSPDALALIDELLNVRGPLSVAVASRRALSLRLAKLRAAGRVRELGPAELSFSASYKDAPSGSGCAHSGAGTDFSPTARFELNYGSENYFGFGRTSVGFAYAIPNSCSEPDRGPAYPVFLDTGFGTNGPAPLPFGSEQISGTFSAESGATIFWTLH
jgi:hypothetical protein